MRMYDTWGRRERCRALLITMALLVLLLILVSDLDGAPAQPYTSAARYVVSVRALFGGPQYAGRQMVCWASRRGTLPPEGCVPVAGRSYRVGQAIWVHRAVSNGQVLGISHR